MTRNKMSYLVLMDAVVVCQLVTMHQHVTTTPLHMLSNTLETAIISCILLVHIDPMTQVTNFNWDVFVSDLNMQK